MAKVPAAVVDKLLKEARQISERVNSRHVRRALYWLRTLDECAIEARDGVTEHFVIVAVPPGRFIADADSTSGGACELVDDVIYVGATPTIPEPEPPEHLRAGASGEPLIIRTELPPVPLEEVQAFVEQQREIVAADPRSQHKLRQGAHELSEDEANAIFERHGIYERDADGNRSLTRSEIKIAQPTPAGAQGAATVKRDGQMRFKVGAIATTHEGNENEQ